MDRYCEKCGIKLDKSNIYTSKNLEKYPLDGWLPICKKCIQMEIDNKKPETFQWVLKEIDVPYIEEEWNHLIEKYGEDVIIIGRYLAKMKLRGFKAYTYADSNELNELHRQHKIEIENAKRRMSHESLLREMWEDDGR